LAVLGLLGPALHSFSIDLRAALEEHSATMTSGRRRLGLRSAFVVVEVAVAILLAGGTSLLVRAYGTLDRIDLGYDPGRVAAASLDLSGTIYQAWPVAEGWANSVLDAVRTEGGQQGAFWAGYSPSLAVGPRESWTAIEGRPDPKGMHRLFWAYHVSDGFFSLFDLHPAAGRLFGATDRAGSTSVVIINEAAANAWWPGEAAIGKRMKLAPSGSDTPWLTVVGVVPNTERLDHTGLFMSSYGRGQRYSLVFLPFGQSTDDTRGSPLPLTDFFVGIQASPDPRSSTDQLRQTLQRLGGTIPPTNVTTLRELQRDSGNYPEILFSQRLLGCLAGFALVLAAIGVFGVVSENIRRRTGEIGIRRALGAGGGSIAILVSRPALIALASGLGVGAILGIAFKSALVFAFFGITSQNHYGLLLSVSPGDIPALLLSTAWFLGVSVAALLVPLRRALKIDPMQALRQL